MNDLQIFLNNRQLASFTQQDFLRLQQRVSSNQTYTLEDYLIQKKLFSTQWTSSYQALNSKTRTYHFVKIYHICRLIEEERPSEVAKLRQLSRKMMKMNPDHVMKCYETLENDDFLIMVMEICKEEDTLWDVLEKRRNISQSVAVEWIKQIICGLAELYRQNIYLSQIRADKICVIDDRCKLNDFKNIERKLTLTEADIVKKHILQLAWLFCVMLNGGKHIDEKQFDDLDGLIENVEKRVKMSQLAKDFLRKSLSLSKNNSMSWQQLISHKLFNDESKRSSNTEFLKLSQIQPKIPFKKRGFSSTILASKLKQSQFSFQQQEEWDCYSYIQIEKTKLILDKIIHDIDEDKVLDVMDRQVIQIVYLMAVRCLNNFNEINMTKSKHQNSQLLPKFKDYLEKMEKHITKIFYKYSTLLTKKQNQKMQVGKDWLNFAKSIAKLQFFQSSRRNKFLTGIESTHEHQHDYTKQQQIDFTHEMIINFLKKLKFNYTDKNHVYFFILNYKRIMEINLEDLEFLTFGQKVKQILESGQNQIV